MCGTEVLGMEEEADPASRLLPDDGGLIFAVSLSPPPVA
jgi:hypothetical protein